MVGTPDWGKANVHFPESDPDQKVDLWEKPEEGKELPPLDLSAERREQHWRVVRIAPSDDEDVDYDVWVEPLE